MQNEIEKKIEKKMLEKAIKNLNEIEKITIDTQKTISEKMQDIYFLGLKHGKDLEKDL